MSILNFILMSINDTDFVHHPWNVTFGPWTDLFSRFVGNGNVFFLFPLVILTVGLHFKTHNTALTSCFMIASGALLSVGTYSMGVPELGLIFAIFAAMGLVPLFSFVFFGGD